MLTDDHLRAIIPALTPAKRVQLLPFLQAAMSEFAIDRPARAAAFVAQLAHESGQFRFMEELWGPTEAQRRYEPASTLAAKLGNTAPGDGRLFKGRGPIQITGRANYQRYGSLLGIDLLSEPSRAALPEVSFRIAALFWNRNGLNELADQPGAGSFRAITKRINGGLNGLKDREHFYGVACAVLGVADAPVPRGLEPGLPGRAPAGQPFERGFEAIRSLARARRPGRSAASSGGRATRAARTAGSRRPKTAIRKRTTKKKSRSG
jgi:predicted chitinase